MARGLWARRYSHFPLQSQHGIAVVRALHWWERQRSNLDESAYEAEALPVELHSLVKAGLTLGPAIGSDNVPAHMAYLLARGRRASAYPGRHAAGLLGLYSVYAGRAGIAPPGIGQSDHCRKDMG